LELVEEGLVLRDLGRPHGVAEGLEGARFVRAVRVDAGAEGRATEPAERRTRGRPRPTMLRPAEERALRSTDGRATQAQRQARVFSDLTRERF
jgi:hypothetical protein